MNEEEKERMIKNLKSFGSGIRMAFDNGEEE